MHQLSLSLAHEEEVYTAHHAIAYGGEVFAFPGRVGDPKSVGCLKLIKKYKARLITSVEDVVEWLEWTKEEETKAVQKQLFVSLTAEEKKSIQQ